MLAGCWFASIIALSQPTGLSAAESNRSLESMDGFVEAIRLEDQLSQEKQSWERQKRILQNEIEVLRSELRETERRVESIRSDRSDARKKREELLQELASEQKVEKQIASFTSFIAEDLERLFSSLPPWSASGSQDADFFEPDPTPIALLRLLEEIQAEGQRIQTQPIEVIDPSTQETYRVDLLSLGLSAGFFSSENGSFAGRFNHRDGEWEPEIENDLGPAIRSAIAQERGAREPSMILLPVEIQELQ